MAEGSALAIDPFAGWMADLSTIDLSRLERGAARRLLGRLAAVRSALDGFEAKVAAVLVDDPADAAAAVRGATRCTQREADRVARRSALIESVPAVADSLATGAISGAHADVLARAAERTSAAAVERSGLLDVAGRKPADAMRRELHDFVRRETDADDLAERQRRARAARRCVVFDDPSSGMTVLHAEFDPVTGAKVRSAIDAATDRMFRADGGRGSAAGVRLPEQRRADALAALVSDSDGGGRPAVRNQVVFVVHADGSAEVAGGQPVPLGEVMRELCGADLRLLATDAAGDPLWLGHKRRLASDGQWTALMVRDGGCVACGARPSRCEAHHVRWVEHGGRTDIDNLVLLCGHHHHLVHDQGWQITREEVGGWTLAPP